MGILILPLLVTGLIIAPVLVVLLSRQDTLLHIAYAESSLQLFLIIVGGACICQTIYMIREDDVDDNVFKFFSIAGVALVIYAYLWAQVYMVLVKDDILFYDKDKYIQEYIDDYEYTKEGFKNRKEQLIKDYEEQKVVRNQEDKDRQEYEEFKKWKENQKNDNQN